MSKNYIDVSVSTSKPAKVSVASPQNKTNVDVTRDTSAYNAELAKQWATAEGLILNEDYSAKYYSKKAKESEQFAKVYSESTQNAYENLSNVANGYVEELTETKEAVTEEISISVSDGLLDINKAKEEAVEFIAENADVIGYETITDEVVDVEILEQGYVTDYEFKEAIGDISTVLDTINGEVV